MLILSRSDAAPPRGGAPRVDEIANAATPALDAALTLDTAPERAEIVLLLQKSSK